MAGSSNDLLPPDLKAYVDRAEPVPEAVLAKFGHGIATLAQRMVSEAIAKQAHWRAQANEQGGSEEARAGGSPPAYISTGDPENPWRNFTGEVSSVWINRAPLPKRQAHTRDRHGGHNPNNFEVPYWASRLDPDDGVRGGVRTSLMKDTRDDRVVSPFQGWFPCEIVMNANSGVNVVTEARQVIQPRDGYFLNLFTVHVMEHMKVTLVLSMDCSQAFPCGAWDEASSGVLHQPMFQPFEWPRLGVNSPNYAEVKVKIPEGVLLHLVFKGFRSDKDMTLITNCLDETLLQVVDPARPGFQVQVVAIAGDKTMAFTFEPGQRIYALGPHGTVVAGDFVRSHIEFRSVDRTSADAAGQDADQVEFKLLDARNQIAMAAHRLAVPPTWVVISHVSGSACARLIQEGRNMHGRVEAPDQMLQFSQLSAQHSHWLNEGLWSPQEVPANSTQLDTRILTVRCDSAPSNLHFVQDSKLFPVPMTLVPQSALGLGAHDPSLEVRAAIMPPMGGLSAQVIPAAQAPPLELLFPGNRSRPQYVHDDRQTAQDELERSALYNGGLQQGGHDVIVMAPSFPERMARSAMPKRAAPVPPSVTAAVAAQLGSAMVAQRQLADVVDILTMPHPAMALVCTPWSVPPPPPPPPLPFRSEPTTAPEPDPERASDRLTPAAFEEAVMTPRIYGPQ